MILRIFYTLIIGGSFVAAIFLYNVKYEVEAYRLKMAQLRKELVQERDQINVLRTEWSHLSRPDRLQELAQRYKDTLGLEPVRVEQVVSTDELPLRPRGFVPEVKPSLGGYAGSASSASRIQ